MLKTYSIRIYECAKEKYGRACIATLQLYKSVYTDSKVLSRYIKENVFIPSNSAGEAINKRTEQNRGRENPSSEYF
jgi:hypothetical protein